MPGQIDPPPLQEAVGLLRSSNAFAGLAPDALERVAGQLRWVALDAGDLLYAEGDAADGLAFLAAGRLRALRARGDTDDGDDAVTILGEIAMGEVVGEMALLSNAVRTATVIAVRDSVVAQLPSDAVTELLDETQHPAVALMRVAAVRLLDERSARLRPAARVVAVVAMPGDTADVLARDLGACFESGLPTVVHDPAHLEVAAMAAQVDAHERAGEVVVLAGANDDPAWIEAACRQADAVVILGSATTSSRDLDASIVARVLAGRTSRPRTFFVVRHDQAHPRLPVPPVIHHELVDEHLHLCPTGPASVRRLARRLRGRSVGLALAGGGARAFAHLGVYRALYEAGVAIDATAGSSVGAAMAVLVAQGEDPADVADRCVDAWRRAKIQLRVSLPTIALTSGPALRHLFEGLYGDLLLEELPIECLVTTVELSAGALVLHRRGAAARWVQASASPPGLSPPVVGDDGSLHIDGAVGDNLPVAGLVAWGADRVIAVNVSPTDADGAVGSALRSTPGPVRFLVDQIRGGASKGYPNVVSTLLRSTMAASRARLTSALDRADLVITPDVRGLPMSAYGRAADAIEPGYEAASAALASVDLDDWR